MANEYTSIATTPGLATELVQPTYDLAVKEARKALPTIRQFVDVRPEQPAMRGSSVTMERFEWFSEAVVTAAKTPLTEEADVDSTKMPKPTPVTITPNEYGFAVTSTRKLSNRVFAPFDGFKARAIALHLTRVIDELLQDTLVAEVTGANVLYGGDATSNATIDINDKVTASLVRKVVSEFRANNVETWDGQFYGAVVHPYIVHDLREETGSGSWRVPNEYGTNQSKIWAGEFGEFEGVRFVQNNLVRITQDGSGTGADQIHPIQSYFFGRRGLAEHVVEEPHVVVGPVTDKLKRFATLGWYGDFGFKVYDAGCIRRVVAATSLDASLPDA